MGIIGLTLLLLFKKFQYIIQKYSLPFHDKYMIVDNNLPPEKSRWVWEQATDEIHLTTEAHTAGTEAVQNWDPWWGYNATGVILVRYQFTICLLAGLCKIALKPVNYENLQEITQDKQEKPMSLPRTPHKRPHRVY